MKAFIAIKDDQREKNCNKGYFLFVFEYSLK